MERRVECKGDDEGCYSLQKFYRCTYFFSSNIFYLGIMLCCLLTDPFLPFIVGCFLSLLSQVLRDSTPSI